MSDSSATMDGAVDGATADANPCETVTLPVDALERFVNSFEKSARRWEFIAYPSLVVLVVLLAYGFFLIYSLTHDIRQIAERFDPKMSQHMAELTRTMDEMTKSVETMTVRVSAMAGHTGTMTAQMNNLETMSPLYKEMVSMNKKMTHLEDVSEIRNQMVEMNNKMSFMTADMGRLRYDMSVMNRSVSRPMSFMNSFMPW